MEQECGGVSSCKKMAVDGMDMQLDLLREGCVLELSGRFKYECKSASRAAICKTYSNYNGVLFAVSL